MAPRRKHRDVSPKPRHPVTILGPLSGDGLIRNRPLSPERQSSGVLGIRQRLSFLCDSKLAWVRRQHERAKRLFSEKLGRYFTSESTVREDNTAEWSIDYHSHRAHSVSAGESALRTEVQELQRELREKNAALEMCKRELFKERKRHLVLKEAAAARVGRLEADVRREKERADAAYRYQEAIVAAEVARAREECLASLRAQATPTRPSTPTTAPPTVYCGFKRGPPPDTVEREVQSSETLLKLPGGKRLRLSPPADYEKPPSGTTADGPSSPGNSGSSHGDNEDDEDDGGPMEDQASQGTEGTAPGISEASEHNRVHIPLSPDGGEPDTEASKAPEEPPLMSPQAPEVPTEPSVTPSVQDEVLETPHPISTAAETVVPGEPTQEVAGPEESGAVEVSSEETLGEYICDPSGGEGASTDLLPGEAAQHMEETIVESSPDKPGDQGSMVQEGSMRTLAEPRTGEQLTPGDVISSQLSASLPVGRLEISQPTFGIPLSSPAPPSSVAPDLHLGFVTPPSQDIDDTMVDVTIGPEIDQYQDNILPGVGDKIERTVTVDSQMDVDPDEKDVNYNDTIKYDEMEEDKDMQTEDEMEDAESSGSSAMEEDDADTSMGDSHHGDDMEQGIGAVQGASAPFTHVMGDAAMADAYTPAQQEFAPYFSLLPVREDLSAVMAAGQGSQQNYTAMNDPNVHHQDEDRGLEDLQDDFILDTTGSTALRAQYLAPSPTLVASVDEDPQRDHNDIATHLQNNMQGAIGTAPRLDSPTPAVERPDVPQDSDQARSDAGESDHSVNEEELMEQFQSLNVRSEELSTESALAQTGGTDVVTAAAGDQTGQRPDTTAQVVQLMQEGTHAQAVDIDSLTQNFQRGLHVGQASPHDGNDDRDSRITRNVGDSSNTFMEDSTAATSDLQNISSNSGVANIRDVNLSSGPHAGDADDEGSDDGDDISSLNSEERQVPHHDSGPSLDPPDFSSYHASTSAPHSGSLAKDKKATEKIHEAHPLDPQPYLEDMEPEIMWWWLFHKRPKPEIIQKRMSRPGDLLDHIKDALDIGDLPQITKESIYGYAWMDNKEDWVPVGPDAFNMIDEYIAARGSESLGFRADETFDKIHLQWGPYTPQARLWLAWIAQETGLAKEGPSSALVYVFEDNLDLLYPRH